MHTDTTPPAQSRSRRHRRLTPSLVLSVGALFLALSGAAVALPGTDTVDSGDIVDDTVRSEDIKNDKVKTADLQDEGVTKDDLGPGSVGASEIGDAIEARSASVSVPGGVNENGAYTVRSATASCEAGEELIGGSARWQNEQANEELFIQEINLNHGAESVTAAGGGDVDEDRTFMAVALCLG
jgi:hypothetical protein